MSDELRRLQDEVDRLTPFAAFGSWAFEMFWCDGCPGDVDAGDAQEKAVELGLLGRTVEVDPEATHADGCDCSPDAPPADCCCFAPMRAPLRLTEALADSQAECAEARAALRAAHDATEEAQEGSDIEGQSDESALAAYEEGTRAVLRATTPVLSRPPGSREALRAMLRSGVLATLDAAGDVDIPCQATGRATGCLSNDPDAVKACMERDREAFAEVIVARLLGEGGEHE